MKRHMENTGGYLRKEVKGVEAKIAEAKGLMKKSLGVSIDDISEVDEYLSEQATNL